jgi:predicted transcriptional regulator
MKTVLTNEELDSLKSLKEQYNQLALVLGRVELEILNLIEEKEKIKQQFSDLKNQELDLVDKIKTKYGEGSVSLETGEFLPAS